MTDRFARYGASTGVLFVVLTLAAFLTQPKPPASDASPSEVFSYVVDHQDALHVTQLIFGGAVFFFLWFIGTLRAALGSAEGGLGRLSGIAYGGGLIGVATLVVGLGLAATAALHPADNGPDLTRALIDASVIVFAVGAPAVAVFFVANSLAIIRSGYLPSWLGWLGLVTALFNALGIGAVFTDHGVFAADGALNFPGGFGLFMLWTLLTSIMLVRRLGEADAAPAD